ncbi:MAG: addiction module protein [Promethearchaeota archaeon]
MKPIAHLAIFNFLIFRFVSDYKLFSICCSYNMLDIKMASNINEIEKKALNLSIPDRGILIQKLILSLENDEENLDNLDVEKQWINESNKRFADFSEGKTKDKPFQDALREARARLK